MRKILSFLNIVFTTLFLSILALFISFFDRKGSLVHRLAKFWARVHLKVCGINVHVEGLERVNNPPYIFMCNHSSALDIFALLSVIDTEFKWVAKRELFFIPFFGWALKGAGYIGIDRENAKRALRSLKKAAFVIKENGVSLIVFPEGTRSRDGNLLPFKKGGFFLAFEAETPIIPVGIIGTMEIQPRGSFLPRKTGEVLVRIGQPIKIRKEERAKINFFIDEVKREIERLCQLK